LDSIEFKFKTNLEFKKINFWEAGCAVYTNLNTATSFEVGSGGATSP
jgi:hypothetical protein